jgi:hypothetical protein
MAAIAELGRGAVAAQAGAGQADAQLAAVSGSVRSLPEAHDLVSPARQQRRMIPAHGFSRLQARGLGAWQSWGFRDSARSSYPERPRGHGQHDDDAADCFAAIHG